jgi:hypothetical protein
MEQADIQGLLIGFRPKPHQPFTITLIPRFR